MTELTCERCGTKFLQQPNDEVSSSKILCVPCATARRAERLAVRAPATAAGGGEARKAVAAPVPVAKPASVAKPAAEAKPAAAKPAAAKPAAAPRPPVKAAASQAAPAEHHFDVAKRRADESKKVAKIAWLATGVLGLIVGIIVLVVMSKQSTRQGEIKEYQLSLDALRTEIMTVSMTDETALKRAKERIATERKLWKGTRIEGDITAQLAKVQAALRMIIESRGVTDQLTSIESKLKTGPDLRALGDMFVASRDQELKDRAGELGGELASRLATAQRSVSALYVQELRTAATAANGAKTSKDLEPFGLLEDTLRVLVEDAQKANDVDSNAKFREMHRQVVKEVNLIGQSLFTAEYIARVEWVDLLSDPNSWQTVVSPSFKSQFGGSGLLLTNEKGESAASGGLSYLPGRHWRDYVIEVEFTINSGMLVFYTRIESKMDSKMVPAFSVGTKNPNVAVEYGKPYVFTISVIANRLLVMEGDTERYSDDLMASKSRRGEPGIVVQADTTATIVRMRARLLR